MTTLFFTSRTFHIFAKKGNYRNDNKYNRTCCTKGLGRARIGEKRNEKTDPAQSEKNQIIFLEFARSIIHPFETFSNELICENLNNEASFGDATVITLNEPLKGP